MRNTKKGITIQQVTLCAVCSGKGTIIENPCKKGNGQVTINRSTKKCV